MSLKAVESEQHKINRETDAVQNIIFNSLVGHDGVVIKLDKVSGMQEEVGHHRIW